MQLVPRLDIGISALDANSKVYKQAQGANVILKNDEGKELEN